MADSDVTIDDTVSGRILVADDDAVTRRLLDHHLRQAGFEIVLAEDGRQAMARMSTDITVALFDLQMPQASGLDCLRFVREHFADTQVIVISQFGEVRTAVEAIKQGAFEYITKPIDPDELVTRVRQSIRSNRLARENRQLRQAVGSPMPDAPFVGASPAARKVLQQVEKVSDLDASVLITGESGTGKSTLARKIHQTGPRHAQPFVAVSCAALPRDLIEAELFGHARGAFTGAVSDRPGRAEMAHGGTLFLDEIGDLPLELQPKLLAFLQDRTVQRIGEARIRNVDVRVISATNQDLEQRCSERVFRKDLYFRLNVLPIHVPPLRARREDIGPLVDSLLARIARQRGTAPCSLTDDARARLLAYDWPGNVRELENVLERASAFCNASVITGDDLNIKGSPETATVPASTSLAGRTLADIERQAILDTLQFCDGNKKAAARQLGIDEKSIYNKIKRLGLKGQV